MALTKITKDGQNLLVDAGSAHMKRLVEDEGYTESGDFEQDSAQGQGTIPSVVRPALPHPAHPHSQNTSGSHAEALAADRIRIEHETARKVRGELLAVAGSVEPAEAEVERRKAVVEAAKIKADAHDAQMKKNEKIRKDKASKDGEKPAIEPAPAPKADPKATEPKTAEVKTDK